MFAEQPLEVHARRQRSSLQKIGHNASQQSRACFTPDQRRQQAVPMRGDD